jgi:SAM-dependent methyltransferase
LSFEDLMRSRGATEYADFVLPSIGGRDRLVDVGCGPGSITVGLAQVAGHVTGIDVDEAEFADARAYAEKHGIDNVEFLQGSIYDLGLPDTSVDVCTLFSMMETLDDPLAGLAEVRRVVKPGGLVAASSIEYGGLVLHGIDEGLLRRFCELRLQLWEAQGDVHFYPGRELRGLLLAAGFRNVEADLRYLSYGTEERVRTFGRGALPIAGTSGTGRGSRNTGSWARTRSMRWSRPGSVGRSHPTRSRPSPGAAPSDVGPERGVRRVRDCTVS